MAWVPIAAGVGGSLVSGMLGNKGAKQAANSAASAQQNLQNQMFQEATKYQQQQEQQLRNEIAQLVGGGNPFFSAAQQVHPQQVSPFNAVHFGPSGPVQQPGNKQGGQQPGNKQPGSMQPSPLSNMQPGVRAPIDGGGAPPAVTPQSPAPGPGPMPHPGSPIFGSVHPIVGGVRSIL